MRIILTGKPRSGKSSLIREVIRRVPDKCGVLTEEILESGNRVGFLLVPSHGESKRIAQSGATGPIAVGRYVVDVQAIDSSMAHLSPNHGDTLLYIDEIGQMQLYSTVFREVVNAILTSRNDFLGTITQMYTDPFLDAIWSRNDILFLTVTPDNRDQVKECVVIMLNNRAQFNGLAQVEQIVVTNMAKRYIDSTAYLSLRKLFGNALTYYATGKVSQIRKAAYRVTGKHASYTVNDDSRGWSCECPLANGRTPYDAVSECSHLQAVRIFAAAQAADQS